MCATQGFHLEYLRHGDSDKPGGRGKRHGTMDRLLRLANDATLREELTSFPLALEAEDAIPTAHRSGVAQSVLWRLRQICLLTSVAYGCFPLALEAEDAIPAAHRSGLSLVASLLPTLSLPAHGLRFLRERQLMPLPVQQCISLTGSLLAGAQSVLWPVRQSCLLISVACECPAGPRSTLARRALQESKYGSMCTHGHACVKDTRQCLLGFLWQNNRR